MSDLPPSEKKDLEVLQQIARQARTCADVSKEDLERMKDILKSANEQKMKGLKPTALARTRDVINTVSYIRNEVSTISYFATGI